MDLLAVAPKVSTSCWSRAGSVPPYVLQSLTDLMGDICAFMQDIAWFMQDLTTIMEGLTPLGTGS